MPNTANAKKALRQNEKRRLRNRADRSALRTVIKKCRLAASGTKEEAQEAFRLAVKKLDQSAAKKLIHRNTASRLKSRLSAFVKKTQMAAAASTGDENA